MPSKSKVYQSTDEEFRQLILDSKSYCDCARQLGMSVNGGNAYRLLKKRCQELNISCSHFETQTHRAQQASTKFSLDEIMVENSSYSNHSSLKKRIIAAKILPYQCALCGNTGEWNGRNLVLQLDHINGKHNDHRLENLRFLCPNCHSQTETFSGKNK